MMTMQDFLAQPTDETEEEKAARLLAARGGVDNSLMSAPPIGSQYAPASVRAPAENAITIGGNQFAPATIQRGGYVDNSLMSAPPIGSSQKFPASVNPGFDYYPLLGPASFTEKPNEPNAATPNLVSDAMKLIGGGAMPGTNLGSSMLTSAGLVNNPQQETAMKMLGMAQNALAGGVPNSALSPAMSNPETGVSWTPRTAFSGANVPSNYSGMLLDSGGTRSTGNDFIPPGWFDNPANRLQAAIGLPAATQLMFHNDAAMQLERMKGETELAKARILMGQRSLGDLKNPNTPPTVKHSDIENTSLPEDEKAKLHLGVDLGNNPTLTHAVQGFNPLGPLNPTVTDPRGANAADLSELSKSGHAQKMDTQTLNDFLSEQKVTPDMIRNRLYELIESSRGHYALKGLFGGSDVWGTDYSKPKVGNLTGDQQRELDFILKKFGNPDMQKMSIADFLGGMNPSNPAGMFR